MLCPTTSYEDGLDDQNCAPLSVLQLGIALGFLIPPMLVPNVKDTEELAQHIRILMYISAGVATGLFLLVIIGRTGSAVDWGRGGGEGETSAWLSSNPLPGPRAIAPFPGLVV